MKLLGDLLLAAGLFAGLVVIMYGYVAFVVILKTFI